MNLAVIATTTPFLGVFLEKRLKLDGFETLRAANGDEALDIARREDNVSVLLMQAGIPGTEGFEICRSIIGKGLRRGVPVIAMSGDPRDEARAVNAGAARFLGIPFSESELMNAITRVIHNKKCILMVDDSKVIHKRTGEFLRGQGYLVIDAYDGAEGFEMARREKPDLIISDVEMPVMDGYEMCKRIKNCPETALIPTVIVSSLGKGLDIDRGFEAGANDYLIKPVVHEELHSCVNMLLHKMEVRRRETVLIVDDSPTIVNMLQFGLMQQGFRVIACTDGEQAYEQAIAQRPDIIVADLDMPRLDGYQLIRYLREKPETANIPVLIISSRESRAEAARGLRISASAFVSKPFSMDRVVIHVERLTAERRLRREREALRLYMSEAALEAAQKTSMHGDDELHASEKELTILFSDIVGFTSICEERQPQDVVSLLNSYLDTMTTVLKNNGAIIDKFIGDAILAIFGSESSNNSPQYQAVKSAIEMLEKQVEFNAGLPVHLHTRIGINSGQVIFGDIGSRYYRRDFTVIGDNVNIAQRLQVQAEPDTILISESVYTPIRESLIIKDTGTLGLKGRHEKIKTYQALGLKPLK